MKLIPVILIAAAVFGLCYGLDKAFTKVFRGTQQHKSGKSVRLSKHYGGFGLVLMVLGVAAVLANEGGLVLTVGGVIVMLFGLAMIVYYMTFGVFYDGDSFVLTSFGKKSKTYRYREITGQQLYISGGNIIVELYMTDGRTVQIHQKMSDWDKFLDHAFNAWCCQKGIDPAACDFHDTANSCWFPKVEG